MKFIIIILGLFFVGCTVTKPHISEYRIVSVMKPVSYDSKSCKKQSLKIGQVFSSNSLMSQKMKYLENDFKEYAFTESEWAQSPNRAVGNELVKSIRDSGLFFSVNNSNSRTNSDLILETSIDEFVQHFVEKEKKSFVKVVMSMTLIDAKTGTSISSTVINKSLDTQSYDAVGGVKALNSALSDALVQSNHWLNEVCQ